MILPVNEKYPFVRKRVVTCFLSDALFLLHAGIPEVNFSRSSIARQQNSNKENCFILIVLTKQFISLFDFNLLLAHRSLLTKFSNGGIKNSFIFLILTRSVILLLPDQMKNFATPDHKYATVADRIGRLIEKAH